MVFNGGLLSRVSVARPGGRWPEGFHYPRCGRNRAWAVRRELWHCTLAQASDSETSLISGTLFQDTRKPLQLWFQAIWYVTTKNKG